MAAIPLPMTPPITDAHDTAEALFTQALHAIHEAYRAGRISWDIMELRETWLIRRFGEVGVDRQIAVCLVVIRICGL